MIWSESRKFCFIHIPKTGGSAISFAYARAMRFGDVMLGGPHFAEIAQEQYLDRFGLHKHSGVGDVMTIVGEENFRQVFSFAVVRSPTARLISFYKWLHKPEVQNGLTETQLKLKASPSFQDFAIGSREVFWLQRDHVVNQEGHVCVTKLIHFGRLAEEWKAIALRFGLPDQLPIENQSPSMRIEVDEQTEQLVQELYAPDVELLKLVDQ